jgi:hypothetical protein
MIARARTGLAGCGRNRLLTRTESSEPRASASGFYGLLPQPAGLAANRSYLQLGYVRCIIPDGIYELTYAAPKIERSNMGISPTRAIPP